MLPTLLTFLYLDNVLASVVGQLSILLKFCKLRPIVVFLLHFNYDDLFTISSVSMRSVGLLVLFGAYSLLPILFVAY